MKNKYDFIKAIAILLVVLGHTTNHYSAWPLKVITITIYLFHMSLFIAVSGAVFKMGLENGKYVDIIPFLATKAKRLLVPFIMSTIFVIAPTLVVCKMSSIGYIGTVISVVIGGVFIKHLWYLQALFWIFLLAWCTVHIRLKLHVVFLLSLVLASIALSTPFESNRYLSLGMAINYFPSFILGMLLLNYKTGWKQISLWLVECIVFGTVLILSKHPVVDNFARILFSSAIVGLLIALSEYAYRYIKNVYLLTFLAKNSFGIYLFHMTPIYLLRYYGVDELPLCLSIPITFFVSLTSSIALTLVVRGLHLQVMIGEK